MSRPRYDWWPYVKGMIRRYPMLKESYDALHNPQTTANYSAMPRGGGSGRAVETQALLELSRTEQREYDAVRQAIVQTATKQNGVEQLRLIHLLFWEMGCTLEQAAHFVPCSSRSARRYHTSFIMSVAKNYGLLD